MTTNAFIQIAPDSTGKKVDNALLTLSGTQVYRQRVEAYTAEPLAVSLNNAGQVDAFGRVRISEAYTLFDSQQEYGLDTRTTWDCTANGVLAAPGSNGSVTDASCSVGPTDINTRLTPLTVSTVSGQYAVLQSKQYVRYVPGKSHLVLMTGVFSPGAVVNTDARVGYFDSANGIFVKSTGGAYSIVRRTSTSGAPVDNEVLQADWNMDKLDGLGPSGITLDLTKTNILFIQAQWLGVGQVVVGFDIDGVLIPAHAFKNANALTVPYTQTFNLPVRMELRNTGVSTGATISFVCCSVQSEGGQEVRGFPFATPPTITTTAVTTRRPVLSLRPKATYNSRTNRAQIEDIEYLLRATTNDAMYEIVVGGVLTGAAWTSVAASSVTEYDTTATAISGGVTTLSGFVISGSGSASGTTFRGSDLRNPLVLSQIDALTANQTNITLVCTSFSATSNITAVANWHEQVI